MRSALRVICFLFENRFAQPCVPNHTAGDSFSPSPEGVFPSAPQKAGIFSSVFHLQDPQAKEWKDQGRIPSSE